MKLDKDSSMIVGHLKSYVKQIGVPIDNEKLTPYMGELFSVMKKAYIYANKIAPNVKKTVIPIDGINNTSAFIRPELFGTRFISESVRTRITETVIYNISYSFKLFERDVNIIFNICDINDIKHTDIMMRDMLVWLFIVNLYSSSRCSKKIDIYIFLCDSKKRMPVETIDIIGTPHVNSAYTYCCSQNNRIVIYRKEEWFKVFVHETMHSFGMDFCGKREGSIAKRQISAVFDIQSNMYIYEAYCELWALIISNSFSIFLNDTTIPYKSFIKKFSGMMKTETVFSTIQMNKMLSHMGLEYKDLYSKTRQSKMKRDVLFQEESEVFSYFIVKTILLHHYDQFLVWCGEHNNSLLNFKKNDGNINEFCNLIISLYKNKIFLDNVNEITKIGNHIRDDTGKRAKFITNTARMSAHSGSY